MTANLADSAQEKIKSLNSSPEGHQKNRRIDIVLIPKLEPLLKMMNQ